MEELITQVTERTGISAEQARQAVETVLGFVKQRLPEGVAGYVDTAVNSGQTGDVLGGAVDKLGGLFGGE